MFAAVQQQGGSVGAVPGNVQNPHPAAGKWPELGLWIRTDGQSHSFPSQPQPAKAKFFTKA